MPRTTVNIDGPIFKELKQIQKREGKPLGRLISELLARALVQIKSQTKEPPSFHWISRPMGAQVDLLDKDAVRAALDREQPARHEGLRGP